MTGSDLIIAAPWIVFAVVLAIVFFLLLRSDRAVRRGPGQSVSPSGQASRMPRRRRRRAERAENRRAERAENRRAERAENRRAERAEKEDSLRCPDEAHPRRTDQKSSATRLGRS